MKKRDKVWLIISLSLFIILSICILLNFTNSLDSYIQFFILKIRNPKLTKIMTNITNIGGAYSLCAISLLLLFVMKNKKDASKIFINLVMVFLTSQLFKVIFRRIRPISMSLINATGYSYPSGHMMVSTAYFAFVCYLVLRSTHSKLIKILWLVGSIILVTLIGFSRIYLGVHYFTDVLGGLFLGIAFFIIFINIISNILRSKK